MGDMRAAAVPAPAWNWQWFLLSIEGRITRSDYWLRFFVPYLVISTVAGLVDPTVSLVVLLVALWPSIAVGVKRCHDRDRSGWFLLIAFIPLIGGLWLLIELGCLRGTVGPNRFGPDPLQS